MGDSSGSGKRSIGSDGDSSGVKKAKIIADAAECTDDVFVKVLIPGAAAGGIIGKGGEAMRKMHEETGCRVKMSKGSDCYPGTNERIAIIQGPVNAAMKVMKHFMSKIKQNEANMDYEERGNEVKIVVPNTSAAMVIGKSGAAIKEIRERTAVGVQINPKQGSPDAQRCVERVITISQTNQDKLEEGVTLILTKVCQDPNHQSYTNLSYASGVPLGMENSVNSEPHNFAPFGRQGPPMPPPFQDRPRPPMGAPGGMRPPAPQSLFQSGNPQMGDGSPYGGPPRTMGGGGAMGAPPSSVPQPLGGTPGKMFGGGHPELHGGYGPKPSSGGLAPFSASPSSGGGGAFGGAGGGGGLGLGARDTGGGLKVNPLEGLGNNDVLQFLDSLQSTLRSSGFNEQAVADIMQAMQVLAKYNIMGLGLGLGVAAMATMRAGTETNSATSTAASIPSGGGGLAPATQTVAPTDTLAPSDYKPFPTATNNDTSYRSQTDAVYMGGNQPSFFRSAETPPRRQAPVAPGANGHQSDYYVGSTADTRQDDVSRRAPAPVSRWEASGGAPSVHGVHPPSMGGGQSVVQTQPAQQTPPQVAGDRNFAASVMKLKPGGDPRRMEFELPEQIVGAVMGPKATTLSEIQRYSGATVEISRKSDNSAVRIVTIRGSDPESVRAGRFMVERAINEEQKRRQMGAASMY